MRRLRRNKRNNVRGMRLIQAYAEAAKQDNPTANKGQIENMVKADLENDFEDRPILAFLLDLLVQFLPLILDGLFDSD